MNKPRRRGLLLFVAACFATGVAVLLLMAPRVTPNTIGYEVAKGIVQFLTVSLLGAAVAFVVGDYQRGRETWRQVRDKHDEALRRLDGELAEAYRAVKKARRLLRAAIGRIDAGLPLPLDAYDQHIGAVNEAQLDIEALRATLRVVNDPRLSKEVVDSCLRAIDDYLSELIDEHSDNRRTLDASATVASLARLHRFVQKRADGGDFPTQVAVPVRTTREHLTEALLAPFPRSGPSITPHGA